MVGLFFNILRFALLFFCFSLFVTDKKMERGIFSFTKISRPFPFFFLQGAVSKSHLFTKRVPSH